MLRKPNDLQAVVVTNLSNAVSQDDIFQLFSGHTGFQSVETETIFSETQALVIYNSEEGVLEALGLNGLALHGMNIVVQRTNSPNYLCLKQRNQLSFSNRIFVGNLAFQTTEDSLRRFFEPCGEIESVNISTGKDESSKGFAFVTFVSADAVPQALTLNDTQLDGRIVRIKKPGRTASLSGDNGAIMNNNGGLFGGASRETTGGLFGGTPQGGSEDRMISAPQEDNTILVRNLSPDTTEESLRRMFFRLCGPIKSVKIVVGQDGRSRGFGFITFTSANAIPQALAKRNLIIDSRNITVELCKSRNANDPTANAGGTYADPFTKACVSGDAPKEKFGSVSEAPRAKRKAQAMFEKLYTSKKFADVAFDVQGEEILAHKAILSQESKYFEELLSGTGISLRLIVFDLLLDDSQSGMARITISDVTPSVFKVMLEYVYRNDIQADEDLIIELIKLSEKYAMPDMKQKCESTLQWLLSTENFVKIAKVVEEYKTARLKDALLSYTLRNGVDMIDKKDLIEIPREILIEMVEKLSQRTAQTQSSPNKGQVSSGFTSNSVNSGIFRSQQSQPIEGSTGSFVGNRVKL